MHKKIVMFYPQVSERQIKAVVKTLHSRFIGQGPRVDKFEKEFAKKFSIPFCVAVNSGSAALETACDMLGLKAGDKVITTPFTCTATNLPLVRRGCKLIFADIDPKTLNISQASIDHIIKNYGETDSSGPIKAIMNVHLGGILSDIDGHGIPVIDDAAQAVGLFRKSATFTCYSFQAIKHITTVDGGMFCANFDTQANKAILLRWFGIDRKKKIKNNWDPMNDREMVFDIEIAGHKRHMNDVAAAMGIEGLKDYDKIIAHRKKIFDVYRTIKADGFKLVDPQDTPNVYWTAACLVDRRNDFRKKLLKAGIETNVVQVRNDIYKIFGGTRLNLPNLNAIDDKYIYLPLHSKMTINDALYIRSIIEKEQYGHSRNN